MQIESKRLDQMQNRPRHRAQANRRPRIAGDTRRVVAQMRRARLGFRRILSTHHRIRHIDRIAVRVGYELIRPIIRLAIPVFEHRLDLRLRIRRRAGVLRLLRIGFMCHTLQPNPFNRQPRGTSTCPGRMLRYGTR